MADEDRKGKVVERRENSIVFHDWLTDLTVHLPREQIAIIHDVDGEIVSMPKGLAKSKGLI